MKTGSLLDRKSSLLCLVAIVVGAVAAQGQVINETFDTLPTWTTSIAAGGTWTSAAGGQSGNYMRVQRSSSGSSVNVKVYSVATNALVTFTTYFKVPAGMGTAYWMENAVELGSNTASDFDTNSASWTYIKKYADNTGTSGAWVANSVTVSTGASTQVSVGYKLGASNSTAYDMGWDTAYTIIGGTLSGVACSASPLFTNSSPTQDTSITFSAADYLNGRPAAVFQSLASPNNTQSLLTNGTMDACNTTGSLFICQDSADAAVEYHFSPASISKAHAFASWSDARAGLGFQLYLYTPANNTWTAMPNIPNNGASNTTSGAYLFDSNIAGSSNLGTNVTKARFVFHPNGASGSTLREIDLFGTANAGETLGSLTNPNFATAWTFGTQTPGTSAVTVNDPSGWFVLDWGTTVSGAGPMQYNSTELATGAPQTYRCKWEFNGSGNATDNVIAKEIAWGSATNATVAVWCAGRTWGATTGTMSLGLVTGGNGKSWADTSANRSSRTSNDESWAALSKNISGGPGTLTVMLDANPASTNWNCQFTQLAVFTPPPAPTVGTPTSSSLNVAVNASTGDPQGTSPAFAATYAISIGGGAYTLGNHWVQSGGTVSTTAVYQTKANWGTKTVTGLAASTLYTFQLKAAVDTSGTSATPLGASGTGTTSGACTPPATPGTPGLSTPAVQGISVANAAGDSGTPYYAFRINGGGLSNQYVQSGGTVGASAAWQLKATWATRTVTGLSVDTQYTFDAIAANDASGTCPSGYSTTAATGWTLANTPGAPAVASPTATTLSVTANATSESPANQTTTQYAITITGGTFGSTDGANWVPAAGGTPTATAAYQAKSSWTTKTVTGLAGSTTYTFKVIAKNGAGTVTGYSAAATGTTLDVTAPAISAITPSATCVDPGGTISMTAAVTDAGGINTTVAPAVGYLGPNLVTNPGAASGMTGWTNSSTPSGALDATVDWGSFYPVTPQAHDSDNTNFNIEVTNYYGSGVNWSSSMYQDVAVTNGATYYVSAWFNVKINGTSTTSVFKAGATTLGTWGTNDSTWNQIKGFVTASGATLRIQWDASAVVPSQQFQGCARMDDVEVRLVNNASSFSPSGAAVTSTTATWSTITVNTTLLDGATSGTLRVVAKDAAANWASPVASSTITINPAVSLTVSPATQTISAGSTATVTITSAENGVNYQLWNVGAAANSGSPGTGTGANLALTSAALSTGSPVTLQVKATRGSCTAVTLTGTSVVTLSFDSTPPTVSSVTPSLSCADLPAAVSVTASVTDNIGIPGASNIWVPNTTTNMLTNPSFESALGSEWTNTSSNPYSRLTGGGYPGPGSIKDGSAWAGASCSGSSGTKTPELRQAVTVTAGTPYWLSVWVTTAGSPNTCSAYLQWRDGAAASDGLGTTIASVTSNTGGWQQLQGWVKPTQATLTFIVKLSWDCNGSGGGGNLDAAELRAAGANPSTWSAPTATWSSVTIPSTWQAIPVAATDAAGNLGTGSGTINTNPSVPTGATATPAAICNGQSSTLSATLGGGGDTLVWHSGSCTGTIVTSPVSPGSTTTYYVATKNSTTTCVSSTCASVTVTVNAPPAAPTGGSSTPNSTTQITWGWTVAGGTGNTYKGYDASSGGSLKWTSGSDASSYAEGSGLSANTQYQRWVSTVASTTCESSTRLALAAKYTLQTAATTPTYGTVTTTSIVLNTTGPVNLAAGSSGVIFKRSGATDLTKVQALTATDTSLTPNTSYTYTARGVNGDGTATNESTASTAQYTLAQAVIGQNLTCDRSINTWYGIGTTFTFSNPVGFGTGGIYRASSFEYKWNTSATESWSTVGTAWSSGTVVLTAAESATNYLHVRAINGQGVANNTNVADFGPFEYDATAPTVSAATPADGAEIAAGITSVSVTFSESVSGVVKENLTVTGATVTGVSGSGAGPYVFTLNPGPPDGDITLILAQGSIVDHAGNPFAGAQWACYKDTGGAPTLQSKTPEADTYVQTLSQVQVSFNERVYNVAAGNLTVNGSPATNRTGSLAGPYTFSGFGSMSDGVINVVLASGTIRDVENLGFTQTGWSFTLDHVAPTNGTISINSGATYANSTSVALALSATDATSGVDQMRFSNDNSNWSSWEAYGTSKSWTLASGADGSRSVYVQYRDKALNATTGNITAAIGLDTAPPTSVGLTFDTVTINSIAVIGAGTDAYSGVDASTGYKYSRSGASDSDWADTTYSWTGLLANTQYTGLIVTVTDRATNTAASTPSQSKYTLIETPTGVAFGTLTPVSIEAIPTGTLSHLTAGSSGVVTANATAGNDSGWAQDQSGYVSMDLSPNTAYTFVARARNGESVETADSTPATKYTLQVTPAAVPTFSNLAATGMTVTTVGPLNLTADSSGVIFNRSDMGDLSLVQALSIDDSGLSPNTQYTYKAKGVNGDGTATDYSGTASKYTLQAVPTTPTFSDVTDSSLTVSTTGPANLTAGNSGVVFNRDNVDLIAVQSLSGADSGLTPNTQYTYKAKGVNADNVATDYSVTNSVWTLSAAPASGSVTPDNSAPCTGDQVIWTATGAFGAGRITKYKYAWDQNDTHDWTGSEPDWSSGTLPVQVSASGTWYLHVKGYNGAGVANGTYEYVVVTGGNPASIDTQPSDQNVVTGGTAAFTVGAAGGDGLSYQWQKWNGSAWANVSNGGGITGATSASLSVGSAADVHEGQYRCVVTPASGCGGNKITDARELTIAPRAMEWYSVMTHGTAGEMALPMDPTKTGSGTDSPYIECRRGDLKIRVKFDKPVLAPDGLTGALSVKDSLNNTCTPGSVALVNPVGGASDTLELTVAGSSVDQKRLTAELLTGKFRRPTSTKAWLLGTTSRPRSCQVRCLVGDVNWDGNVNLVDMAAVKYQVMNAGTVTASTARYDVNLSGKITLIDMALVKSLNERSVP